MKDWYFPQEVHEAAHKNYIKKTGCTPEELREYCLAHIDFFLTSRLHTSNGYLLLG